MWVENIVKPVKISKYDIDGARSIYESLRKEFETMNSILSIVHSDFSLENYRWEFRFTITHGEAGLSKKHIRAVERIAKKYGLRYDYLITADESGYVYMYITFI
ncbi:MAG: hypothetical protein JHC26_08795, partial [Thermofilum sp.]|uniref:hypothetical protein n=1 Tax=Thermofilum sp. TaxID=1961369 RepID=UPI0025866550